MLTVKVEPGEHVVEAGYADLAYRVESEIVSRCEIRPVVEVVAPGTLGRTEFKAKRVTDLR